MEIPGPAHLVESHLVVLNGLCVLLLLKEQVAHVDTDARDLCTTSDMSGQRVTRAFSLGAPRVAGLSVTLHTASRTKQAQRSHPSSISLVRGADADRPGQMPAVLFDTQTWIGSQVLMSRW